MMQMQQQRHRQSIILTRRHCIILLLFVFVRFGCAAGSEPTPPPIDSPLPPPCDPSSAGPLPDEVYITVNNWMSINGTDVFVRLNLSDVEYDAGTVTYYARYVLHDTDQHSRPNSYSPTLVFNSTLTISRTSTMWARDVTGESSAGWDYLHLNGNWDRTPTIGSFYVGYVRDKTYDAGIAQKPKDTLSIAYVQLMPYNRSDLACLLTFHVTSHCCEVPLPPLLVVQPYWVLLVSTIAYFVASYVIAHLLTCLERFDKWRRMKRSIRRCLRRCCCCCLWCLRRSQGMTRHKAAVKDGLDESLLLDPYTHTHTHAAADDDADDHAHVIGSIDDGNEDEDVTVDDNDDYDDENSEELIDMSGSQSYHASWGGLAKPNPNYFSSPAVHPIAQRSKQQQSSSEKAGDSGGTSLPSGMTLPRPRPMPIPIARAPITASDRLANANALYLLIQLCVVVGNLFYLILLFCLFDDSPADAPQSAWWRYQRVLMFWQNSSQATLLASALASYMLLKYQLYRTLQARGKLPALKPMQRCRCCARCCYQCFNRCRCCGKIRHAWNQLRILLSLKPRQQTTRYIALVVLLLNLPGLITNVIPVWILFFPFLLMAMTFALIGGSLVFLILHVAQMNVERVVFRRRRKKMIIESGEEAEIAQRVGSEIDESLEASMVTGNEGNAVNMDGVQQQKSRHSTLNSSSDSLPSNSAASSHIHSTSASAATSTPELTSSSTSASHDHPARPPLASTHLSVEFAWYSVLLLRLLCTCIVVAFIQTSFNYAYILYIEVDIVANWARATQSASNFGLNLWGYPISAEYLQRNTEQWMRGIVESLHQFYMQLSMFL